MPKWYGPVLVVLSGAPGSMSCDRPSDKLPRPLSENHVYLIGYRDGRRDEQAALCDRVQRHKAVILRPLGQAHASD